MSNTRHSVRPGAYYDSVVLMQLQKALAALPGVFDAGVVMATEANRELLGSAGFDLSLISAAADDLLIVVSAESEQAADDAIGQVDELIKRRRANSSQGFRPRSLSSAASYLPDASWVIISVPGRYAAGVAEEALDLGKNVFLYSDNVTVEDEVRLKRKASDRGLMVMGPDCGTAIINGTGFGFANHVRRGNIGVVAASGTGLQAVTVGVHKRGAGISQALGTGGRDLKSAVGGITALQAVDLLARDPDTKVIVLVSKPPDGAVAARLLAAARTAEKPVVVNFIGFPPPATQLGNLHFATTLAEAARIAVSLGNSTAVRGSEAAGGGFLRGLFSGGTLAYETMLGLQATVSPLYSNVPIRSEQRLADSLVSQDHTILDLGEDEFTQGRPHPMMDNDLRIRRIRREAADPDVSLLLLDVVLGEGAHPDPASELAPVIAEVKSKRDIDVAVIVLGTEEDPQGLAEQVSQLSEAGAVIFYETDQAVAYVSQRMGKPFYNAAPPVPLASFQGSAAVINVGVESFYDSLIGQGVKAIHVDWRPPASGNQKLMDILAKMKQPKL